MSITRKNLAVDLGQAAPRDETRRIAESCRSFSGVNYFLALIRLEARRCIKVLQGAKTG